MKGIFIVNVAAIKKNDIANGVGVRVSLFVSGCRHHCKNCFNKEAWDFNFGKKFTSDIMEEIMSALEKNFISGLTVLGGEPFENENLDGVFAVVKECRKRFPQKNIWCYTGFDFEKDFLSGEGERHQKIIDILSQIDVLVDGKFIEEKKDLSLLFRGSSNQNIIDVKKSLKENKLILLDGKWERTPGSTDIYEI